MGNSRFVLAINGILMISLGGAFWFYPEFFSKLMFPNILDNDIAMNVAIALRKNMGAGCAFIGVIMFTCQSSPKFVAQRLLFSSAFGFFMMVVALYRVRVSNEAQVPFSIIIFFSILGLISFYVASRKYQS